MPAGLFSFLFLSSFNATERQQQPLPSSILETELCFDRGMGYFVPNAAVHLLSLPRPSLLGASFPIETGDGAPMGEDDDLSRYGSGKRGLWVAADGEGTLRGASNGRRRSSKQGGL